MTIIGAGAVGSALALAFYKKKFIVRWIVSKEGKTARKLGRRVHAKYGMLRSMPALEPGGTIFLAVPDDQISSVARTVAHLMKDFSGTVVFHCSGALSSATLRPLQKKGAAVGSFHPLQTFPGNKSDGKELRNIWIGIEGDPSATAAGKALARVLGSRPLILSPRQKMLYHIGAVFSSNYFTAILSVVEELGRRLGLPREQVMAMYEPLILRSYANTKSHSAAASLTGPVARGDAGTVRKHRQALRAEGMVQIEHLYTVLAKQTALLASKKGQ